MFDFLSKAPVEEVVDSIYLVSKTLERKKVKTSLEANEKIKGFADKIIAEIESTEKAKLDQFSIETITKVTSSISEWLNAIILTKNLTFTDLHVAEITINSWLEEGKESGFEILPAESQLSELPGVEHVQIELETVSEADDFHFTLVGGNYRKSFSPYGPGPTRSGQIDYTEDSPSTVEPKYERRLSARNVNLPLEVSEEERVLHNDARRFARLLVSEIKLYNEQKVKEGREVGDIYSRLHEAIDRSRTMYDKRRSSVVAAKFDYFHHELVTSLAEGDENKLGKEYHKKKEEPHSEIPS